jgi:hypothetical protein
LQVAGYELQVTWVILRLRVSRPDLCVHSWNCRSIGKEWLQRGGGMSEDLQGSDQAIPSPNGCRWCGLEERDHFQRWKPPVGWHQWAEPTSEQRKERMRARRRAKERPEHGRLQHAKRPAA